ncbi:MAG: FAD-dependent oxidoreductase, partial [Xanthomonadales bacterium]|nr:FAD-dependent oxidoreductase [Xanthomonadales bacterium]
MRIGIVGAGISGLAAGWYLSRDHEVVVFEAGPRAGGHTDTHELTDSAGLPVRVDSGFIVFNAHNYPGFCALLDELGVGSRASDMGFSVSNHRSGIEYGTSTLRELLADPRNLARPRFLAMLRDLRRFYRQAPSLLDADPGLAIGDWLAANDYSEAFAEEHLLPMVSALWSAGEDAAHRFPARFLAEFMANHRMLQVNGRPQWRTVLGGSQRYVEALTARWQAQLRVECPVRRVRREGAGVRVSHPW